MAVAFQSGVSEGKPQTLIIGQDVQAYNSRLQAIADDTNHVRFSRLTASAANAAGSLVLPANAFIHSILVKNNTANAVTGGIKFGSASGGTEIVVALTVGANFIGHVLDAALLLRFFSTSATQTIYYDAVVAWNNANVNITIIYEQL